ncbi:MAG TPA: ABC transporter permease, partial [Candidatus Baltobacteraceae bacterium]
MSVSTVADTPPRSYLLDAWRRLYRSPGPVLGITLVTLVVLVAIFAPLIAGYDPLALNLANQKAPPSLQHLMGTDGQGYDVFSRVVFGARISVYIGFVAVGIAISAGTLIGTISGFYGRTLDNILMGAMDVMLAFPPIVLAIA